MPGRWGWRRRIERARRGCREPVLERWLEATATLKPGRLNETPILALDLELTSLDPARGHIVSLGWTEIVGGRLRLGANRHLLVDETAGVGDSATIHGLRDRDLAGGASLTEALSALFEAGLGKLFLFHHAPLDVAFLQRACEAWAGCRPPVPALDTLRWERERRRRRGQPVADGDLRLGALRDRYALPNHALHDALGDAVATGELFLAMAAHAAGDRPLALSPLVRLL